MKVSIQFRGPIVQRLEEGETTVEVEAGTLQDILEAVLQQEPYLRESWGSAEEMDRDALILVNEVDIGLTGGLETSLKDGDSVSVLPLVHGG